MVKSVDRSSTYGTPRGVRVRDFENLKVSINLFTFFSDYSFNVHIGKSDGKHKTKACRIKTAAIGDASNLPWYAL
jgi:hypothetical protein